MSTSSQKLITLIEDLKSIFRDCSSQSSSSLANQFRWRPFWEKAREIQLLFNSKPDFSSKGEHQKWWNNFNDLRDSASKKMKKERLSLEVYSSQHRQTIIGELKRIKYEPFSLPPFDLFENIDAEVIKGWQRELGRIKQYFSEVKGQMLYEDKKRCFEYVGKVKDSHDLFWAYHKKEIEQKKEESSRKHLKFLENVRANISKNKERLADAKSALGRCEENISDIMNKFQRPRLKNGKLFFLSGCKKQFPRNRVSKIK